MILCKKCGYHLEGAINYCQNCGQELSKKDQKCNHMILSIAVWSVVAVLIFQMTLDMLYLISMVLS